MTTSEGVSEDSGDAETGACGDSGDNIELIGGTRVGDNGTSIEAGLESDCILMLKDFTIE